MLRWARERGEDGLHVEARVSRRAWETSPSAVVDAIWKVVAEDAMPDREADSIVRAEIWPEVGGCSVFFARQPYISASYRVLVLVVFAHLEDAWAEYEETEPESRALERRVHDLSAEIARALDQGRERHPSLRVEPFECWYMDDRRLVRPSRRRR